MRIGGVRGTTLKDYPDKISSIFFTLGCNFRCPYCYNKKLALDELKPFDDEWINTFLQERKGFSDAIVISGGEPTIQPDLPDFLKKIKSLGYLTSIETNGSRPEILERLINEKLIDFIAMDVKAPLNKYREIVGFDIDPEKIRKSINVVRKFPNHEFRTTIVPGLLDEKDILEIVKLIKGAKMYRLQQFRPEEEMIQPKLKKTEPYSMDFLEKIAAKIKSNFDVICIDS
jgi:pyruvate formate lyase activating enzyme